MESRFLLALYQQFDVDWEPPFDRDKGCQRVEGDHHGALVIGNTATIEPALPFDCFERRGVPFVHRVRRLHVIMRINKNGRFARFVEPLCKDGWLATSIRGCQALNVAEPDGVQPCLDKLARVFHPLCHGGIRPHGRTGDKSFQILDQLWLSIERMGKHGVGHRVFSFRLCRRQR